MSNGFRRTFPFTGSCLLVAHASALTEVDALINVSQIVRPGSELWQHLKLGLRVLLEMQPGELEAQRTAGAELPTAKLS